MQQPNNVSMQNMVQGYPNSMGQQQQQFQQMTQPGGPPQMQQQVPQFPNMMGGHQASQQQLQKYKTNKCRHFENQDFCQLGENCHFAHGDAELRKPEDPLTTEQMNMALKQIEIQNSRGGRGGGQNDRGSRGGGRGFSQGNNMRGNFRGNGRGTRFNPSARGDFQGQGRGGTRGGYNNQNGQGYNNSMGGGNESAGKTRQNYKTQLCIHFQKNGSCLYNEKCCYAHGDHELRASQFPKNQGGQFQAPAPQGMMNMGQMGMPNMGQFQNMLIPQGMFMDPQMQSQMMFQNAAGQNQSQDQNKQMMGAFMPMQQQYVQHQNMMQNPNSDHSEQQPGQNQ